MQLYFITTYPARFQRGIVCPVLFFVVLLDRFKETISALLKAERRAANDDHTLRRTTEKL